MGSTLSKLNCCGPEEANNNEFHVHRHLTAGKTGRSWTNKKVRAAFLEFYSQRGHTVVGSEKHKNGFISKTINRFNDLFGSARPLSGKYVGTQYCVVAQNRDLLCDIGKCNNRHSLYETLFALEEDNARGVFDKLRMLLVKVYGFRNDRLEYCILKDEKFSVVHDDVSYDALTTCGVHSSKIHGRDSIQNFYGIDTKGPCGPYAEVLLMTEYDSIRLAKIYNIGYSNDKEITRLERRYILTQLCVEHITSILEDVSDNYASSSFSPVLRLINKKSKLSYVKTVHSRTAVVQNIAYRIVSDHSRTIAVLLSEDNQARGRYTTLLSRLVRRAYYYSHEYLSMGEEDLWNAVKLAGERLDCKKAVFNDNETAYKTFMDSLKGFLKRYSRGLKELKHLLSKHRHDTVSSSELGVFYTHYGFPLCLLAAITEDRGIRVNRGSLFSIARKKTAQEENAAKKKIIKSE